MGEYGDISMLLNRNRAWSARVRAREPEFFAELSGQQSPRYLWIGCSDSRVPANEIVDLRPGEMVVHRNIANQVVHSDLNCLSVIHFAVEVLKVRHIIVCGHYGCGGVLAALRGERVGLSDNWLRHIQDVQERHREFIAAVSGDEAADRLCDLNVIEQAAKVCRTCIVDDAWARGQALAIHGWIYGLTDGLLQDLGFSVSEPGDLQRVYDEALASLHARS
jgi:carbonic anhydrase